MRIENRSTLYTTARLQPLVDFVSKYCKEAGTATLSVKDSKNHDLICGGMAYQWRPTELRGSGGYIEMVLSRHSYPCKSEHVPEVGAIELHSFEEEFVMVLAHESKHLDDFEGEYTKSEDDSFWEMRAELHAVKVLKAFRKSKTKKSTKTLQVNF